MSTPDSPQTSTPPTAPGHGLQRELGALHRNPNVIIAVYDADRADAAFAALTKSNDELQKQLEASFRVGRALQEEENSAVIERDEARAQVAETERERDRWHAAFDQEHSRHTAELSTLQTDHTASQQEVAKLREALGVDQPWPVADVLDKLADAARILLVEKGYDGHGHEGIQVCMLRAKDDAQAIRTAALAAHQAHPATGEEER